MSGPLSNVRVISIEQYGAGPFGTQYLVDMGAEVIKIESPEDGGDMSRTVGPYFLDGVDPSAASLFFQGLNAGKKSVCIDLSEPRGRAALKALVKSADALTCNLRGDVPAKLGLTYDALKDVNPKIVCAHLTAYGREGPRAHWPGYDYMIQAEAGYFSLTGEPDTPPARFGLSVIDFMAGQSLALAVVSGVLRARETGLGQDVDVSLYNTGLYNLNYLALWYLNMGHVHGRTKRSAHPSLAPCQLVKTADGWIYIMCNKEKFFATLCRKIGRPDLADDPRFRDFPARLENRAALSDLLDEALSAKTTQDWLSVFDGAVPAAPVQNIANALDAPFAAGRIEDAQADGVAFKRLAAPIVWSTPRPDAPAPKLGEHTRAVFAEAGFSEEAITELLSDNIAWARPPLSR